VKDDALWLANEAKVEETAALRIVVLEWQLRPRDRILSVDLDPAFTAADAGPSGASFNASMSFTQSFMAKDTREQLDSSFESEAAHKVRLLQLYLQERLHVLRLADLLIRFYIGHVTVPNENIPRILEMGKSLLNAVCKSASKTLTYESCVHEFVEALQQRINRLESGSGWYAKEGGSELLEVIWSQAQIEEMVPILQLTFNVVFRAVPSSKSTLSYFELMKERFFFDFSLVSCVHHIAHMMLMHR
jgi:nuclear pore complex protein Nup188